jgi:hypothetical protein
VTSTAVLEEVWHIELSAKAGDISGLTRELADVAALLTATRPDSSRSAKGTALKAQSHSPPARQG